MYIGIGTLVLILIIVLFVDGLPPPRDLVTSPGEAGHRYATGA